MIHEEICTYEVSKLAKEKGFNWVCPHYFRLNNKDLFMIFPSEDWSDIGERINAPTQSLLQRWLREEKAIAIVLSPYYYNIQRRLYTYIYEIWADNNFEKTSKSPKTYELALEDALKYVLKNLV